jgi:ECF sigma factor
VLEGPGSRESHGGASEFLVVHEALEDLKMVEPRKAAVIELRFFGGLTFEEIAEAQGISLITAKRDSAYAEAGGAVRRRSLGNTAEAAVKFISRTMILFASRPRLSK